MSKSDSRLRAGAEARVAREREHVIKQASPLLSGAIDESDVIQQYMRRQAETYGLGYVPPEYGGESAQSKLKNMRVNVRKHIRDLFGPSWRIYVSHVGMPTETVKFLAADKLPQKLPIRDSAHHLRTSQLVLLVHIGEIREALREREREIWVGLQQTHDPHLTGESALSSEMTRVKGARQHIREALGKAIKDIPRPYYLPIRALAAIEYPTISSREAHAIRLYEAIEKGEIREQWMSQQVYDGLTDPELLKPWRSNLDDGRKAGHWYNDFRKRERELAGRTLPYKISEFEPDVRARYEEAKAADKLRKQVQRGRKIRGDALPTDMKQYMAEMRLARDVERRQFFGNLERHGVPVTDLLNRHFDKVTDEAVADLATSGLAPKTRKKRLLTIERKRNRDTLKEYGEQVERENHVRVLNEESDTGRIGISKYSKHRPKE